MEQDRTPYLDALRDYAARKPGRFNVPGHKGGEAADPELRRTIGEAALEFDIPAGLEGIDIGPDPHDTPFQRAQRLAAEAWGAHRSWFLVNGASGGNHAICITLAHAGERVVVQRNVHSSIIDGIVLSGLRPRFVAPELDDELGIAHCLDPEALDEALAAEPDAVGAMVVSPTYFGAVADIASLAEVAHSHGVPLAVDEAWGAHLRFSSRLPDSALECGADIVLSSVHKMADSITQSAMLHLGASGARIDERIVDRAVTLVESTSPNSLLTASLDAARHQAAVRGEELLAGTIDALVELREQLSAIPGLDLLDERFHTRPTVHGFDPLRVAIDVRGTGATGNALARSMREVDDVYVELFSHNVIVAVFGLGEDAARTGPRLVEALRHAVDKVGEKPDEIRQPFAQPPPWGPLEITPREAFLGPQGIVAFREAEGRIAAESLAAYPPGVPNVLPGERLSRATMDYIADSIAHGGQVRGASDRTLKTVRVVIE